MQTNRRQFTKQTLGSLLTFTLLETLVERDAFGESIKPIAAKWLSEVNQLGVDLKDQKMKQVEWMKQVESLFAKVELPELLKLIDFEKMRHNVKLVDNGARSLRFTFKEIDGVPTKLAFGKQVFAVKEGRSVVPHGHNNMATAFLILDGKFHGRHYDRLEDQKDHFIIRPTIDRGFGVAEYSSISDFKDNVHWFKATSEVGYIFNIHVIGLPRPDLKTKLPNGRVYLDPNGEKLGDGTIRAKRIGYKESHRLYG